MADPTTPSWYAKPFNISSKLFTVSFPVGILAVLAIAAGTAVASGGVGMVTRDGDLAAIEVSIQRTIDEKVDASATALRQEADDAREADALLSAQRQDEILRRLDRIERTLDQH